MAVCIRAFSEYQSLKFETFHPEQFYTLSTYTIEFIAGVGLKTRWLKILRRSISASVFWSRNSQGGWNLVQSVLSAVHKSQFSPVRPPTSQRDVSQSRWCSPENEIHFLERKCRFLCCMLSKSRHDFQVVCWVFLTSYCQNIKFFYLALDNLYIF